MASKWVLSAHGGPESLSLVKFEVPQQCGPNEVLIKVIATTATYTDLLVMKGNYMPSPPLPLTPGYDLIGEVLAVGSCVPSEQLRVGDRVAAMPQSGCMATHIALDASSVIKIPLEGVSPLEAVVCIRTGVTAYQMLHRCFKTTKDLRDVTILIHGATGATGSLILTLALSKGYQAKNIIGTAKSSNLSLLSAFGVHSVDYDGDWSTAVLEKTAGQGVDLVFDAICLGGYFESALRCLKQGGKYVSYGFTHKNEPGALPIPSVLFFFAQQWYQQHVCSWFDGKEAEFYIIADRRKSHPKEFEEDLAHLLSLVRDKELTLPTGRTWRFAQCKDALVGIAQNQHAGVQVVRVAE